jgi:hypothetical protein
MRRFTSATVVAVALLALTAVANAAPDGTVSKGLKISLNSADMMGAGVPSGLTPQTGFAAGAYLDWRLAGRASIQPEILYTQKGGEVESGTNPYEYHFDYVEIPVLLKLTMAGPGAAFRPHIYAGPFVGFKIDARIETYSGRDQEESAEQTLSSARGIDAGFAVGVGTDLAIGPGRVVLDLRYGKSLVSAMTTGPKFTHSVFSASLGYSFD